MLQITISKEFQNRLVEQFDSKEEAFRFLNSFKRTSIFPIQKVSDAMKESTQVGFNVEDEGISVIDPFDLCGGSQFYDKNYE